MNTHVVLLPQRFPHTERVTSVAWLPDSSLFVSSGADATLRFWESSGSPQLILSMRSMVHALAISPDGRTLVCTGPKNTVVVLSIESIVQEIVCHERSSWQPQENPFSPFSSPLGNLEVDADGCSVFPPLPLPPLPTERQIEQFSHRLYEGHRPLQLPEIHAIAFSPDGQWVASGGRDEQVCIWDPRTLETRYRIPVQGWIKSVAFSSDSSLLAVATSANGVSLWSLSPSSATRQCIYTAHRSSVQVLAFSPALSPHKLFIVSGDTDGVIHLWDFFGRTRYVYRGHSQSVMALDWHPQGTCLASGDANGDVRFWQPAIPEPPSRSFCIGTRIHTLAWHPQGTWLVLGDERGQVQEWSIGKEELAGLRMEHVQGQGTLPTRSISAHSFLRRYC